MQTFPLVTALFAVVIVAVIVLWKAGASAGPAHVPKADNDRVVNQIPKVRDERL